jgi:hypothetical protein
MLVSRNWGSTVGIVPGYGLDSQGVGVRVPVESKIFLLCVVQTGSKAHPASYPMDTRGSFLGDIVAGSQSDHSPPTSDKAKKTWIYTFTPQYVFMA